MKKQLTVPRGFARNLRREKWMRVRIQKPIENGFVWSPTWAEYNKKLREAA